MRVLVVSKHLPDNFQTKVHGVYQRLRMFLGAIQQIAQIEALFYVRGNMDVSPHTISKMENCFSKYWNIDLRLFLSKRSDGKDADLKLSHIGYGMIRRFSRTGFLDIIGTEQIKTFEDRLQNNPDKIFVHRLGSMGPLLKTKKYLPEIYLDLDDIEHMAFIRQIKRHREWHKRIFNYCMLPGLFWSEYKAIRLTHRTFVCSDKDYRYLTNRLRLNGIAKVPNAVTVPSLQPNSSEQTLLFIGSYNYRPNIEAAEFLINKIWPIVHREISSARLFIAGEPAKNIPSFGKVLSGVIFTGFVQDLADLYRRSRVVCVPILCGGGTRIKIIEAAAYSKPIVSTRIGAEGLQMQNNHDILICDDHLQFANACVRLINNPDLCEKLGSAARTKVLKQYDQTKISELIQDHITN